MSLYTDVIHKFTRDNYAKRFPELESLIHTPMEYIKTVKVRGLRKCMCTLCTSSYIFNQIFSNCNWIPTQVIKISTLVINSRD